MNHYSNSNNNNNNNNFNININYNIKKKEMGGRTSLAHWLESNPPSPHSDGDAITMNPIIIWIHPLVHTDVLH